MLVEEKPMIDIKKVRQDFPILSREVYGKPLVYFDNAASSQKPSKVIMKKYKSTHYQILHLVNISTTGDTL